MRVFLFLPDKIALLIGNVGNWQCYWPLSNELAEKLKGTGVCGKISDKSK
jgi:hypothetical protein